MITPQEEIQIADISKELQRQWEEQEAKNQIRASLFNLIIYSQDVLRADYLKKFADAIIEKFPCRIIFIQVDQDPSHNYLRVSVSNVVTSKGEASIACDKINIEVSVSQLKRVPYIILPHLLSDLPIYLLWGQDPSKENEILPHLYKYAKRLIFDSESIQELPEFSKAILKLMEKWKTEFADIHWIVTKSWRDALSRIFDNEEKVSQLHDAKTIRIHYNAAKSDGIVHPDIQAVYLQAWIGAQMGWKIVDVYMSKEIKKVKYLNGARQIDVELIPSEDNATQPGSILSFDAITYGEVQFFIERKELLPQIVVHITTPQECAMPFSLPLLDSKQSPSFLRDLLFRSAGKHYVKTLAQIARSGVTK